MDYVIKRASAFTLEEQTAKGISGIPQDWPVEIYPYEELVPEGFELISEENLALLRANNQAAYDAWLQALRPVYQTSTTQEVTVKSGSLSATLAAPVDSNPFAVPTYRTKRNATATLITIAPDSHEHIDFHLTAERYVAGGTLIVENGVFGDYAVAEIVDTDGVIPEPYRGVLCEAWPTVATYIEKEWIEVSGSTMSKHKIDTAPLNAKVTAGLYLRVTYYAVASGENRRVGVNYYLTKKL